MLMAAVPCGASNPLCLIPQIFAAEADIAIDKATDSAGQTIRHWVGEGAGVALQATATAWTNLTTPAVGTDDGVPSSDVAFLQESVLWLSLSMLILSFLWSMGMMVFTGDGRKGIDGLKNIGIFVGVTALAVPVVAISVSVVHLATAWIIERATGDDFATGLGSMLVDTGGLGLVLYLIITVVAIFVSGFQIVLLIWRGGALIVLTGSIGLAAALGRSVLSKYLGWIVAYVFYELGAGIFYGAAFRLMGVQTNPNADDQSAILIRQVTGVALMFLALLALPAMIRLVAPLSAALAAGRGFGGAAMGALAIVLPTGAIAAGGAAAAASAASSGSGGGGGNEGGDSGPSGAVSPPPSSTPSPPPPSGSPDVASRGAPVPA